MNRNPIQMAKWSNFASVHAKGHMEDMSCIAPLILNLSSVLGESSALGLGESLLPTDRWLGGPQNRPGRFGK